MLTDPESALPDCVRTHVNVSGPRPSDPLPLHVPVRFTKGGDGGSGGGGDGGDGAGAVGGDGGDGAGDVGGAAMEMRRRPLAPR
jgi:hypothetical protein